MAATRMGMVMVPAVPFGPMITRPATATVMVSMPLPRAQLRVTSVIEAW